MRLLKILFLAFTLFSLSCSELIIKDFNYPIMWKTATKGSSGRTLELRFTLPTRTRSISTSTAGGLNYGQYIALRFQNGSYTLTNALISSYSLTTTIAPKTTYSISCGIEVASPIDTSVTGRSNFLYCMLNDEVNTSIAAGVRLTLSITFAASFAPSSVLHNIGIYTSTANHPHGIILDNCPFLGSVGLYQDYTLNNNNNVITLSNGGSSKLSTITSPSSTDENNTLYPEFTITTRVVFQVNDYWYIDPEDFIMYLKYSTVHFSAPKTITTEKASDNLNENKLSETLSLTTMSDGVIITGFAKDTLFPGRKFTIALGGMITTDSNLGESTNLDLYVYYKDTYSVVSYSTINMDIVNMISLKNAKAHHPEYFPIYDGMGWPFQFDFRSTVALSTGGYVVIRQRNYSVTTASVVLVASTCDFSLTSYDQGFGSRWNCYPLRNDFAFETTTTSFTTFNEGSGIFFKLSSLPASTSTTDLIKVRVWGFVEKCYDSTNTVGNYSTNLAFTIRIFKNGVNNDTYSNEANFFTNDSSVNSLLASAENVPHSSNCYPLQTRSEVSSTIDIQNNPNKIQNLVRNSDQKLPIGIEVNNIYLSAQTDETLITSFGVSGNIFFNYGDNGKESFIETNFPIKYIFDGTSNDIGDNNLLFFGIIKTQMISNGCAYDLIDYLPTECRTKTTGYANLLSSLNDPRIQWIFSRDYLTESVSIDNGCQVSWNYLNSFEETSANSKYTLFYGSGVAAGVDTHTTTITSKQIVVTATTHSKNANMSTSLSQINTSSDATGTDLTFKITSNIFSLVDGTAPALSMSGHDCDAKIQPPGIGGGDAFQVGVYTNCLKWKGNSTTATWLYSYFEVQQLLLNSGIYPTRIVRFIKLYPELGVFQNPTLTDSTTINFTNDAAEKWIISHHQATTATSAPFAVCLIEISSKVVNAFKQSNSNTLFIWLFGASLLDSDVTNVSSEYPVSQLSSGTAYGNNSGQTMSMAFRRIGDPANLGTKTDATIYPNITTTGTEEISELEAYFYNTVLQLSYDTINSIYTPTGFPQLRSLYHFYLGSMIYIRTSSNPTGEDSTKNIFIPYLCPTYTTISGTTYPANGVYFVTPIATVAWGQMSAYNSISQIDAYVHATSLGKQFEPFTNYALIPKEAGNVSTVKLPIMTPLFLSPSANTGVKVIEANPRIDAAVTTRIINLSTLKVQFQKYTDTATNSEIQLIATNISTLQKEASAMSVFINDDIGTLTTPVKLTANISADIDNSLNLSSPSSKIYVLGKPFNRFLGWSYNLLGKGYITGNNPLTGTASWANALFTIADSSTMILEGIPRLDVTKLNSSLTTIDTYNYIAIFTQSNTMANATTNNNGILTNLKVASTESVGMFKEFILWNPETSNANWTVSMGEDNSEATISSDTAGNIKISGSFPATIPSGAQLNISIKTGVLAATSVCGLVEASKSTVTECGSTSTSAIICSLTEASANFTVCCYNIKNDNTFINALQGHVYFPYRTSYQADAILTSSLFNTNIYTFPSDTDYASNEYLKTVTFGRSVITLSSDTTTYFPSLSNIKYSISTTNGGIGFAQLTITLPRKAVRGMTLAINGDFSAMKISNITPRLIPTFGSSLLFGANLNQGDVFVDGMYSAFSTTGMTLTLNNMVYKCGLSLASTLTVFAWPVLTNNYSNLSVNIVMSAADKTQIANNTTHTVTSLPSLTVSPIVSGVSTDLCSISSITPRLPGQYAKYTFSYNFSSTSLTSQSSNEILIVFPYLYYGDYPSLICYRGTTLLQCNFIEKSILSIRFAAINIGTDTTIDIDIIGIKNPYLLSDNEVYFATSVNNTNFAEGTRYTIVHGSFKITSGILDASTYTYGNIAFHNRFNKHEITASTSNSSSGQQILGDPLNPRENPPVLNSTYYSLHTFGFSLDIANNGISAWSTGFTLVNSPVLYITFPDEYKFHWYSFTPTATIEKYQLNNDDKTTIEQFDIDKTTYTDSTGATVTTDALAISSIAVVGNQLRMTLNLSTIVFNKYFQYFIIKIANLPPPVDNTNVESTLQQTTKAFEFLLFNSDMTQIFTTFDNLNNFSNTDIATTDILSSLLPQNRGLYYVFNNKKWIVDVYDSNTSSINNVVVRTGRYLTYYFKTRATTSNLQPASISVSIESTAVSLGQDTYVVSPYQFDKIPFIIGIACGSTPGFITSNVTINSIDSYDKTTTNAYLLFMPFSPIVIEIKADEKGVITFTQNNTVRINGSLFVDFTTTTSPFTAITISFNESGDSTIDSTSLKPTQLTTRTVFRITNADVSDTQSYSLGTPNSNCFTYQNDKINFVIDGEAAIIPNSVLTKQMFEYQNSEINTALAPDSINFVFTTVYSQIYVYAALVCKEDDFPSNAEIKSQNVTISSANRTVSMFSEILNIEGYANIQFDNLIRGAPYKLKIIIESTQGNSTLRTSSELTLEEYTFTNGTTVAIAPSKPNSPICASYNFATRPGVQVTDPLLWYWQSYFSSEGYNSTGCVTAVDQYGTNIPGIPNIANETSCGRQNCRFVERDDYVVNQTDTTTPETYTLCAYPSSVCSSNPTDLKSNFDTLMTTLATPDNFKSVLNTYVVPDFNITILSDETGVPSATISDITRVSGLVTFNAVATSPIVCYVKVSSGSAPTSSDFNTCTTDCKVLNIQTKSTQFSITLNVSEVGTYTVYSNCYNAMPCSQASSGVNTVTSFTLSPADIDDITGNTDTSSNVDTNTTSTNSSWLNVSILLVLSMIFAFI